MGGASWFMEKRSRTTSSKVVKMAIQQQVKQGRGEATQHRYSRVLACEFLVVITVFPDPQGKSYFMKLINIHRRVNLGNQTANKIRNVQ